MYRKQTCEVTDRGIGRVFPIASVTTGSIRQSSFRDKTCTEKDFVNNKRILHMERVPIDSQRYGMLRVKVMDIDHQINNIYRQRNISGISQSHSFTNNPDVNRSAWTCIQSGPVVNSSRSSVYMSPPSPNWTAIGNIMTIKRSTSMPGYKSNSVTLDINPPQSPDNSHSVIKKRNSAFQCLKYQLKRVGQKYMSDINDHQAVKIPISMSSEPSKISALKLKKRPINTTNHEQNLLSKSKGIRNSISMFFSKSHRPSKSDSYIMNQIKMSSKQLSNNNVNQYSDHHSSRRKLSYESITDNEDTTKISYYSDRQDSGSYTTNNDTKSVDTAMYGYKAQRITLSDSFSVSSNDQLIGSQTTSLYESNNYNNSDISWKSVVGNVCRSNSKDSAIANSTLSGDGILNQSKRISLTSTISKISDSTTATEDFNDSSYSSFNDLEINSSQLGYFKPRLLTNSTKLKPIHLDYVTIEPPENSDVCPSSDSSTETLKPMSHVLRRRYLSNKNTRSSHSNIMVYPNSLFPSFKGHKGHNLKRSHSWPGGNVSVNDTSLSLKRGIATKPPLPPLPPLPPRRPPKSFVNISKTAYNPNTKMDEPLHKCRLNSSPLLSQYSRLYSLRSSLLRDPYSLNSISGQLTDFTQAFKSSTKAYPVLLKEPNS